MFRDWYERSAVARETFDVASALLDFDLHQLCEGEDPLLDRTDYTQPAIFVGEVAMFRALEQEHGLRADCFGGHSLGEYAALTASGALPFETAVALVQRRGQLLQQVSPPGEGGMLAVTTGGDVSHAELAPLITAAGLDIASLNTSAQRVFAGPLAALDRAELALAPYLDHISFARLNVSAPFHSRWMRPAQEAMRATLVEAAGAFCPELATRVVSNVSGTWHLPQREALVDALAEQLTAPVLWERNMATLAAAAERIIEIGPSRPLSGFFRSIQRATSAVVTFQSIARGLSA
jgi:[acyl-carrier-protein] S-malonyltransferase/trans-AT polyketide synthase/acyltransferase/oxidoreductase domain-containing protein